MTIVAFLIFLLVPAAFVYAEWLRDRSERIDRALDGCAMTFVITVSIVVWLAAAWMVLVEIMELLGNHGF